MPRRKTAARGPQPVQSDYDTDTAGNLTDGTALAPPPARTNTELNLTVLRRYSPDISRIVAIAPFAVVYIFSPETQLWEKYGIEGTLFVCQLAAHDHPRYQVIILNRRSLDNFITELKSGEDVEITDEYVILQVSGNEGLPKIYGLWIYSDNESVPSTKEVVSMSIQECAVRAEYAHQTFDHEPALSEELEYDTAGQLGTDGTVGPVDYANQMPQNPVQEPQVDLLSLLRKPQLQREPDPHMSPSISSSRNGDATGFASMPKTMFPVQRAPANPNEQTRPQPLQQQNALLDLFNSVGRG